MKLLERCGLSKEQISMFEKYRDILLEWNEKFNLTAITDLDEIEEKHFYDSFVLADFFPTNNLSLLDVGSGAGFPGIPLAIVDPTLHVTLLEANGKRITFLKEAVKQLGLTNVEIIQGRAEELKTREKYDIVTARAVKELNILLEISFYLLKVHGVFIAYKGSNAREELNNAKNALKTLGGGGAVLLEHDLPISKNTRVFLRIPKLKETPMKYPRSYGEIIKHPL
jgi:16S rRNA (guanine527-N7)-methyltransferase